MRARGAKVTDIAVLVVAADDGVMPQTKESISHARAADVPIVVAINKIDLPDSNIDRVKAELAQEGLQPEEWGGTTQFAEVSAKTQAEPRRAAREDPARRRPRARPEGEPEHRGVRADHRVAARRRPRPRRDDAHPPRHAQGRRCDRRRRRARTREGALQLQGREEASGGAPRRAGRDPRLRQAAARGRGRTRRRERPHGARARDQSAPSGCAASSSRRSARRGVSLENLFEQMQTGEVADLNLVVKGDVVGSVEAVVSELSKFEHSEVRLNVIHQGVGAITQNDIMLASASDALIVGFNVRPNAEARELAVARGRRDPHVQRHLPAHRRHRAGARRQARRGQDRGDDRRGGGSRAVQGLAPRHDRRLHGHARRRAPQRRRARHPRRHRHLHDDDRGAEALQGRRARGRRRASSAASCSTASTT